MPWHAIPIAFYAIIFPNLSHCSEVDLVKVGSSTVQVRYEIQDRSNSPYDTGLCSFMERWPADHSSQGVWVEPLDFYYHDRIVFSSR